MSRITIFTGNYGSGKTEIALNMAMNEAKNKPVTLVDLDIVNAYFRSSEKKEMLEAAGVKVLHSTFALKSVDLPSLPASIDTAFIDKSRTVFFDVGGDPVGATALGRYYPRFMEEPYEMLYVVNVRRPFSSTAQDIIAMMGDIEAHSRLRITGLINNSNLARDTDVEDLIEGQQVLKEVVAKTVIPVKYVCGTKDVLDAFVERGDVLGEPYVIDIYMRPEWLDTTAE